MTNLAGKHRFIRLVEKYVINPQMRFGVRRGLVPASFALLETTGRRTGQPRHTPIAGGLVGNAFWLVAERGRDCDYVHNLLAEPHVKLMLARRWRTGIAHVLADDDPWQRRRSIDQMHGVSGRIDGAIFRSSATNPLTIRITFTDTP